jgi:hypothetical protein
VEILLITAVGAAETARLVELADEMMEDPQCDLVMPGVDTAGGVVLSVWPASVIDEVEQGLRTDGWQLRRLRMIV